MLLKDEEVEKRLRSSHNLFGQLKEKKNNSMSLFGIGKTNSELRSEKKTIEVEKVEVKIEKIEEVKQLAELVPFNPFEKNLPEELPNPASNSNTPNINNLIENADNQIKLASAHDSALQVLSSALDELKIKISDMKPEKLPSVIAATSKVVESIRKERLEIAKTGKDREVHYHFYTPNQKKVEDFQVIDV